MEAVFLALIGQLNGAVFTLVCIFIIVSFLLYKAGAIINAFTEFRNKNTKIDTAMDGMKESLSEIKATTNLLYQAHLKTIGSASPVRLTPLGENISTDLSLQAKINDHWETISTEINKKNPQNPYDIQVVAMGIARLCFDKLLNETERNEIKTHAFNKGMNLLEIYPVIGIEIRNRILAEKGIPVDDIDKHDPDSKK